MRKVRIFARVILAIILVAGGAIWAYWYRGERLSEQAWDAYYAGRPAEAMSSYLKISKQYPSWSIFEDITSGSHYRVAELEDYLRAASLGDSGRVEEAIAAYENYWEGHYPNFDEGWYYSANLYLSLTRENLVNLNLVLAQTCRHAGEYAKAIEAYLSVLELETLGGEDCLPRYQGDTWGAACQQADDAVRDGQAQAQAAIPGVFSQWEGELAQQEDYEAYILKYQNILGAYPRMIREGQAQATLDRIYREWADLSGEMGGYEGALEKVQSAMQGCPDRLDRKEVEAILAGMYSAWAARLRETNEYEETIEKYQIILEKYPHTPSGMQANETIAEIYSEWAVHLREMAAYEEAIEKYQLIIKEYSHTPAAAEAEADLDETYGEFAAWREENPAIPVVDYPEEVERDADGRWSWTIVFGEKGGVVGYSLSGEGWIYDAQGGQWGTWGFSIDRGLLTIPAGGWAEDSYWVRGDEFIDGFSVFTWSGEDDNGHPITFEEKVHLLP